MVKVQWSEPSANRLVSVQTSKSNGPFLQTSHVKVRWLKSQSPMICIIRSLRLSSMLLKKLRFKNICSAPTCCNLVNKIQTLGSVIKTVILISRVFLLYPRFIFDCTLPYFNYILTHLVKLLHTVKIFSGLKLQFYI